LSHNPYEFTTRSCKKGSEISKSALFFWQAINIIAQLCNFSVQDPNIRQ
jgi:hypothetical protein